jgi:hypothetical protein
MTARQLVRRSYKLAVVLRVAWRKFFRDSIPEKPKPGHSRLKVALHSPTITTAGFSQPQTQLASSRLVGRQRSERWQLTTTELQSRPYWPRRWLHRRLKGYWTSYVRKRVKKLLTRYPLQERLHFLAHLKRAFPRPSTPKPWSYYGFNRQQHVPDCLASRARSTSWMTWPHTMLQTAKKRRQHPLVVQFPC